MRSWIIAIVVATACTPRTEKPDGSTETDPTDTDVEQDTDTGEDTDDTAEDTDTSPDTDTATDTADTDTGEPTDTSVEPACSVDDLAMELVFRVEDDEAERDTFTTEELPTLVANVMNTCEDGPVTFVTDMNCLVTNWTIIGPDESIQEIDPRCDEETTQWNIAASGMETATYRLEALPVGDYDVEVTFGFGNETLEGSFSVEEPEPVE